jgi:hypothetical protein
MNTQALKGAWEALDKIIHEHHVLATEKAKKTTHKK